MPNELSHTFDGKWGREIRAAEQKKSIVTNDKDREQAHQIMLSGKSRYFDPSLEDAIAAALAAVRKETRAAALRGAANAIYAMSRIEKRHESVAFMNGAVWMQNKAAKLIEATIEAAANNKEGD